MLQYVITDSKGFPGKTCGAAVLHSPTGKALKWTPLPATVDVKGKTVTITSVHRAPGFELPPKTPLYFAVNCFQ